MSRKEKKIFINSILILIVILIILIISKTIINQINENKYAEKSVHDLSEVLSYTNSVMDVYSGDIPTYKISNQVSILLETYLPSIVDEIVGKSDSKLKEYFNSDSERIYTNIGINSEEEFIEFAKKITSKDNFKTVTYTENSYEKNGNTESIKFKVYYENGNELNFKLSIITDSDSNIVMKFQII
jgi:hypothetical protein